MDKKGQEDPFRADAALVYRALRDRGPASALALSARCFPVLDGPPSTVKALTKRALRRVFDSLVWLRHAGVALTAVPMTDGTTVFHLGAVGTSVTPYVREKVEIVAPVTVRSSPGGSSDVMDVWHGRK